MAGGTKERQSAPANRRPRWAIGRFGNISRRPPSLGGGLHHGRVALALCWSIALPICAADWAQWRGPQRNGHSSETGLLREWPQDGPRLLWQVNDAGSGF